jgi:hypothetical protein
LAILTDIYPSGNIDHCEGIDFFGFYRGLCVIFHQMLVDKSDQTCRKSKSAKARKFIGLMIRMKNGAQTGAVSMVNNVCQIT